MAQPAAITAAEYLEFERKSPTKHEFLGGRVVAMAGASRNHAILGARLTAIVASGLGRGGCVPFSSDMRVHAPDMPTYAYPDLTVVCGEPRFLDHTFDTLLNPSAIFEVLSPSTERVDRGEKFLSYEQIPELKLYVLVASDRHAVETFEREGEAWVRRAFVGIDAVARLEPFGIDLPLAELYADVDFTPVPVDPGL